MKKQNLFRWIHLIAIVSLLLVGCVDSESEVVVTQSLLATPRSQDAKTDSGSISPIDTPIPDLPGWDAEPVPGKGTVRGYIKITQPTILVGELFLAKSVPTSEPGINLLELDETTAPRAFINRDSGQFIFTDIEPGEYGFIVWEPMNSFPINAPDTQQTLFFEVGADEVVDLGILAVP